MLNMLICAIEKPDIKTLVEILKDLFFEKHLALTVDFDE